MPGIAEISCPVLTLLFAFEKKASIRVVVHLPLPRFPGSPSARNENLHIFKRSGSFSVLICTISWPPGSKFVILKKLWSFCSKFQFSVKILLGEGERPHDKSDPDGRGLIGMLSVVWLSKG